MTPLESFRAALAPPPYCTPSQWAERHRNLTKGEAAAHGPFRFDRAPFQREPLDCLGVDHPAQVVVLMWASGLGKSEAVGNNWLGYIADYAPAASIMAQPTIGEAEKYSKKRLAPLFSSPPLNLKVRDPRERDSGNTIQVKEFPGGSLTMVGANSPNGLSGAHICNAFADEVDRWNTGEDNDGDRLKMLIQRTVTYKHSRKVLITSTPTTHKVSRIELEWATTDQRRFMVPCPHCGEFQILKWKSGEYSALMQPLAGTAFDNGAGGIVWDASNPGAACYQCAHCSAKIGEEHKRAMLAAGYWQITNPDADPRRVGFHVSALYSPWTTWGELAEEFIAAQGQGPTHLRAFVNLKLGECWDAGDVSAVEAKGLRLRLESGWGDAAGHTVPAQAVVLTAGVDIQSIRGCFMVEVVAWGEGLESWSIGWFRIDGDPTIPPPQGIWKELDALLLSRTFQHPTLGPMRISASCVDTGDNTTNAYAFVRPRQKRRVWGIKGGADRGPIWPDKISKSTKGRVDLRVINTSQAKEDVYAWLRLPAPGPGYCHFPKGRESDYFDELTAETLTVEHKRGKGQKRWVVTSGQRNEGLDCRIYAYAAIRGLMRQGLVKLTVPKPSKKAPAVVASQNEIDVPAPVREATRRARPRPVASAWRGAAGNFWDGA